jgi:hypothetical protein
MQLQAAVLIINLLQNALEIHQRSWSYLFTYPLQLQAAVLSNHSSLVPVSRVKTSQLTSSWWVMTVYTKSFIQLCVCSIIRCLQITSHSASVFTRRCTYHRTCLITYTPSLWPLVMVCDVDWQHMGSTAESPRLGAHSSLHRCGRLLELITPLKSIKGLTSLEIHQMSSHIRALEIH